MAKERLKSPRARLFVALEMPRAAHDLLRDWQRAIAATAPDDLRVLPDESLHVTLAFLGYRPEREIELIGSVVERSVSERVNRTPAMTVEFEPTVSPRPPRRPKLYAAPLRQTEPLMSLRAELAAALTEAGVFKDERREFWPHVTLVRVKRSARSHRAPEQLPAAPGALVAEPLAVRSVTLFRSHLEPAGARYEPLARVEPKLSERG